MITDPTLMCELLVGLPDVVVLGIVDEAGGPLFVHVESRAPRPGCSSCGVIAQVEDRPASLPPHEPCLAAEAGGAPEGHVSLICAPRQTA